MLLPPKTCSLPWSIPTHHLAKSHNHIPFFSHLLSRKMWVTSGYSTNGLQSGSGWDSSPGNSPQRKDFYLVAWGGTGNRTVSRNRPCLLSFTGRNCTDGELIGWKKRTFILVIAEATQSQKRVERTFRRSAGTISLLWIASNTTVATSEIDPYRKGNKF